MEWTNSPVSEETSEPSKNCSYPADEPQGRRAKSSRTVRPVLLFLRLFGRRDGCHALGRHVLPGGPSLFFTVGLGRFSPRKQIFELSFTAGEALGRMLHGWSF